MQSPLQVDESDLSFLVSLSSQVDNCQGDDGLPEAVWVSLAKIIRLEMSWSCLFSAGLNVFSNTPIGGHYNELEKAVEDDLG